MTKKLAVWGLTAWKSSVGVIYCLLVDFNCLRRSLICQVIHSSKEIWKHSINGMGEGFPENCIMVSHTLSTFDAASYAMNAKYQHGATVQTSAQLLLPSADLQYRYRYSLYWQCLVRTGYVFCGTLVMKLTLTLTLMVVSVSMSLCVSVKIWFLEEH